MKGAIVLAGGKGKRLGGIEKSVLKIDERDMITMVLESLERICDEIVISVSSENQKNRLSHLQHKVVMDVKEDYGPLSGFYTGTGILKSEYAIVVGCDMPFLNHEVIEFLFREVEGFSCLIPVHPDGKTEPLHSVYKVEEVHRCCKIVMRENKKKIFDMIDQLEKVKFIDSEKLKIFDPNLLTFENVNSWKELDFVRKVFKDSVDK